MGLWAGATPTVCRNGTNQMCLFAMKANCDSWLWDKHEGDGLQLLWWQVRLYSALLKGVVSKSRRAADGGRCG
jgi:hypothetical protein